MKTGATLFSGFEGVGIGMQMAGINHLWGIEKDPKIANVAQINGFNVVCADILECNPSDFERVNVLHASPPCPNFSVSKREGKETELDIALATKVAEFISVIKPDFFTLENVYGYRKSKSWQIILGVLENIGYWVQIHHLNSADFGVPQVRRRMVVRATRGWLLPLLPPVKKWAGWYDAIEDLIPSLPDAKFAPWQLKQDCRDGQDFQQWQNLATGGHPLRAVIVGSQHVSHHVKTAQHKPCDSPIWTITASTKNDVRAWLSSGRVVRITPRCLARFQSFPDWYQLPENDSLARRGIGNAVPPLMMAEIYKGLV